MEITATDKNMTENTQDVIHDEASAPDILANDKRRATRYKRLFIVFLTTTVLLFSGLFYVVFTNYSYLAFKRLVANHYAFPETLETIFRDTIGVENPRNFRRYFDEVVIYVFLQHMREVGGDQHTFLFTPERFRRQTEHIAATARETRQEEITPEANFLRIPNFYRITRQYIRDNRHAINEFDSIVIDLRGNSGGTLNDAYNIAGLFTERRAILGFETARTSLFSRTIRSSGSQFFDFEQIIILQDHNTASAAEVFIMALKENLDNVTTVGRTTHGKGIGQIAFPLRRGFVANVTVITLETPSGRSIHGTGIQPDIFYDGEDIIGFALGLLGYRPY